MALNRNGSPEGSISKKIVTTKGDLITATANAIPSRLAAGSNGDTLVANSAAATGLSYKEDYAAGKNKIINGNMLINQRATTTTINTATTTYTLDRWGALGQATDGVYTVAQDSSAPAGFSKSLKIEVTTADTSLASTQTYEVRHFIEGQNIVDFAFGNANAKTITLSFWVRSSLTGTFGGSIRNELSNRSYVFSYTISVADTWEKKSVTIPGDTTGTWVTSDSVGLRLGFGLGQGTDRLETAGAWYGSVRAGATGQVQVIGTLNATWYLTGVQIEAGSVATAFQTATGTIQGELAACQRYFQLIASGNNKNICNVAAYNATSVFGTYFTKVSMRTAPTISVVTGTDYYSVAGNNASDGTTTVALSLASENQVRLEVQSGITVVQGYAYWIDTTNASAFIALQAEL